MLYLSKESAQALGEVVVTITKACEAEGVELQVDMEHLVAHIKFSRTGCDAEIISPGKEQPPNKKKYIGRNRLIECDGESHTIREWANKLGVNYSCMCGRIKTSGNPYGRKGPTSSDMLVAATLPGMEDLSSEN